MGKPINKATISLVKTRGALIDGILVAEKFLFSKPYDKVDAP